MAAIVSSTRPIRIKTDRGDLKRIGNGQNTHSSASTVGGMYENPGAMVDRCIDPSERALVARRRESKRGRYRGARDTQSRGFSERNLRSAASELGLSQRAVRALWRADQVCELLARQSDVRSSRSGQHWSRACRNCSCLRLFIAGRRRLRCWLALSGSGDHYSTVRRRHHLCR